jgi:lysophospholipase L1-like esterase
MKALLISFILLINLYTPKMEDKIQNKPLTYLALGDSYTIGEAVAESERWPVQLVAKLLDKKVSVLSPKIIATTGWRTDQLKAAIEADKELLDSYDMVSLLIGVNNQFQGKTVESFEPEFEELLQKAIALAGGNSDRIFVVSIPDYGKTPAGAKKEKEIEKGLKEYNAVCKRISKKYKVEFFNITPISIGAKKDLDLVAKDNLHPSGKMYTEWADLMLNKVAKMMKK